MSLQTNLKDSFSAQCQELATLINSAEEAVANHKSSSKEKDLHIIEELQAKLENLEARVQEINE
jgi:hypothetical protein